jgi:lipid-binding SYLF domain-containing protein
MNYIRASLVSIFIIFSIYFINPALADQYTNTIDTFIKSDAVKPFFNEAYGYAVFPKVGKAAYVLGGAYGVGRVYKQGIITGTSAMKKLSLGFQIGAQMFSQIIFFQDKRAYEDFTKERFVFDGSFSAVALTLGTQAHAGTRGSSAGASIGPATGIQARTEYHKGMAVFIHTLGGLMYEMSVSGQNFSFTPIN